MTPAAIIDRLRDLRVPHEDIAKVLGRHRVQATKLMNGQRRMLAEEMQPLIDLISRHEEENNEREQ